MGRCFFVDSRYNRFMQKWKWFVWIVAAALLGCQPITGVPPEGPPAASAISPAATRTATITASLTVSPTDQPATQTIPPEPDVITGTPTPVITSTLAFTPTSTQTSTSVLTLTPILTPTELITTAHLITTTWPFAEANIISSGEIQSAVWLPERDQLAVATSLGLFIWDVATDQTVGSYHIGEPVWRVAVDPWRDWLVYGGPNGRLHWRNVETGQYLKGTARHYLGVSALQYTHNGFYLVSGSDDGNIRFWNAESVLNPNLIAPEPLFSWHLGNRVKSLTVSPDDLMVAGADHRTIRIWSTSTGELIHMLDTFAWPIQAIAFDPQNSTLAVVDAAAVLQIWDTAIWTRTHSLDWAAPVLSTALVYLPDGRLALGFEDGSAALWALDANQLLVFDAGTGVPLKFFAMSADAQKLAAVYSNGTIRVWHLP